MILISLLLYVKKYEKYSIELLYIAQKLFHENHSSGTILHKRTNYNFSNISLVFNYYNFLIVSANYVVFSK